MNPDKERARGRDIKARKASWTGLGPNAPVSAGREGSGMTQVLRLSPLLLLTAALIGLAAFFVHDSRPIAHAQLDSTEGICGRTQEVQNAILGELAGVSNCANVTDSHLAGITELVEWRFTSAQAIKSDDFAGLSALTDLELISDEISVLPEDVFEGLDSLEYLLISIGKLESLPEDVF